MSGQLLGSAFLGLLDTLDLYVHQYQNGQYSGARRSSAYGSSSEFADYRDYVPGDDLRRVDWNLAGRFDRYYIKRFTDEKQGRNCVYIDASASMGLDEEKGRMALQMAAVLGYLSVSNMDCVSYRLLKGDRCIPLCENVIGHESLMQAFKALEQVEFSGGTDIGKAVRSDPSIGRQDGISYLISDFLTDSDWHSAVDYLVSSRETVVIQTLSSSELNPAVSGNFTFSDVEQPSHRMSLEVDRSVMQAYQQALNVFLKGVRDFCAGRGVRCVMLRSDEPIEEALLKKGYAEELIR